jgi:peptidoglycan/LPS O-acetylase OafA/YrhL
MQNESAGHRFLFLDALRGIGAIIVMLYHYAEFLGLHIAPAGFVFVDFFFLLSGFVIAHAFKPRIESGLPLTTFLSGRLIRLYPLYLFGLALGAVILFLRSRAGLIDLDPFYAVVSVVANLVYMPYFHHAANTLASGKVLGELYPANGPAWSLFFELLINLAFFYLIRVDKRLLALSVAAAYALLVFRVHVGFGVGGWGAENFFAGLPRVYYGFFTGCLLYEIFKSTSMRSIARKAADWSPTIMLVIVCVCGLIAQDDTDDLRIGFLVAVTVFPILILAGAMVAVPARLGRLCAWLGGLSYPIYCIHYPVGLLGDYLAVQGYLVAPAPVLLAAETCITLAVSLLAMHFYEAPAKAAISALLTTPVPGGAQK